MIRIKTHKTFRYIEVEITGHAGYAESGKDIVCAAVSMLFYAFVRAADRRGLVRCEYEGEVTGTKIIRTGDTERYYEMLMVGLEQLEESYGDFVSLQGRNAE